MIGAAISRREDVRVLRGETRYLDDLDRPGMVHAAFVRSPYAHAAVVAVAMPEPTDGAVVLTGDDLGELWPFPVIEPGGSEVSHADAHPVLAGDEVRYAGQPVALVLSRSRGLAEDAAELVQVEYEPRPVVVDPRVSDATMTRWRHAGGDVAGAFAVAAHVVSGSYALPRVVAAPIEPRGVLAEHDPARDELTVWCSAQDIHRPLAQLSHILGRRPESIRLIIPDVGGAFGSKGVVAPEVAAVAAAAIRLGTPVKWTEDRLENLVGAYQGRGIAGDLDLALDADGRMLGLRARLWADLGGYLLTTTPVPPHTAATLIAGCYDIPAADVQVTGMRTNKVPTGPCRGAGRPEAAYMIEALVDDAARRTGIDRIALRRRNLIRTFPHRTVTGLEYDSGDFGRCLDRALELLGSARTSPGDGGQPTDGTAVGSGVAMYVERAGGGFESAAIELGAGGRFEVASSSSPHGQGHDITFAQIAADRLRVPPQAIALRFGDSATSPPGVGTFGSRSTSQAGSAVALAAEALVRRATETAARQLGTAPTEVRLTAEGFTRAGADADVLSWADLAAAEPEPLRAQARFESGNVFSSGAYAADVAIDRETGTLSVQRLVAVDDAGTIINPLLAHGQVLGGVVHGLGECLTEEAVYDEDGQMRSGSFLDYNLLTAAEVPPISTGEVATPSPLNPLGAKGAGEGGAIGTVPAIANAVADALGGRRPDLPFTAETLWRALHGDGPEPAA